MNNICVTAKNLSKSFTVIERKNMFLSVLLSLVRRESLKYKLQVLRNLSCVIKKGEKLALLGRNGCGKTTFLRILTGIYYPTSGTFQVNGTPKILFHSSIGINAHISVIDNIYLLGAIHGIENKTLKKDMENILETAELGALRHCLLKNLSSGQVQRLALSIFFHSKVDLLIFDEALAYVDNEFVKTLDDHFKQLAKDDTTVIITSHDTSFLKKHCTTALWIEDGKVRMHGAFNEVHAAYERSFVI